MSYNDFNVPVSTNYSGEHIFPRGTFNSANQLIVKLDVTDAADGDTPTLDSYIAQSYDGGVTWEDSDASVVAFTQFTDTPGFDTQVTDDPFSGDLKLIWIIAGGGDHGVLTVDPTGSNNSLDYTGKATDPTDDNQVSIEYADIGVNDTIGVVVTDHAIKFNLVKADAVKALVATALTGNNNDLDFKARAAGTAGNSITVAYLNDVAYAVTSVSVSGSAITVHLRSTITDATLTTALSGANNDLVYTAKAHGAAGNAVSVKYTDPAGNNQALSVSVSTNDIEVHLATNGGGSITSTAAQVAAAIVASTAANALVTVANSGADTGAGVVTALSKTSLSGGNDKTIVATGQEVLSALSKSRAAQALISADLHTGNDGTGVVTALGATSLATGAAAAITTTGDEIKAALIANATANALVGAADHAGNDGSGVVTAMAPAFLDNAVGTYTFRYTGFAKGPSR